MKKSAMARVGRTTLWILPAVAVVVGLAVAMPWLKLQNPVIAKGLGITGVVFLMGYSLYVTQRQQRRLDEVQVAMQGFANSRGWIWGGMATVLLLLVPPVMDGLVAFVNEFGTGSAGTTTALSVRLAFFFGVSLVMMVQALCVSVAAIVWWRRMGGADDAP
ncbi:MAG: hypothetical protein JSR73_08945 [Proteobacteria bacterium]|nr:hypothetical protein [Pseudomonadota bacterium]